MLLWDAMTAAEQAAEEREEEEAEGEEGEEGDARMLTLENLAQARPPLSISRRDRRDAPPRPAPRSPLHLRRRSISCSPACEASPRP